MKRTFLQHVGDWLFFLVMAPAWLALVREEQLQQALDEAEGEALPCD